MLSHRIKAAAFGMIAAFGLAACAFAADWPQYLGPQRDGVAHDAKGLARAWPAPARSSSGRQPVGTGYGGAAIYGDSVLLLDREDERRDVLRRFNLADGKEVWQYPYDAPGKSTTTAAARRRPPTANRVQHRAVRRTSPPSSSATEASCGKGTC